MEQPTFTRMALDENKVAEREQARKQRADEARLDTEFVLSDARGRRFVADLLKDAKLYQPSMATDPSLLAFNEGARNGGLRLLQRVTTHCPDLYLQMEKERING